MIRHLLIRPLAMLLIACTAFAASAQYGHNGDRRYRERYAHSNTYGDVVEIRVREAGVLESQFPKDMTDRVRLLHIEGPLDVNDFKFLKKLCGRSRCIDNRDRRTDNYIDLELERARIIGSGGSGLFNSRGEHDVLGDGLSYASHLRSIVLPERLKRIDHHALRGCYELEEVIMPPSVRSIGDEAFENCSRLNYIALSDGLQRIGNECFSGCSKLADVSLPRSLTEIGDKAFENTALRRITLPNSLEVLGAKAFEKTALTTLCLPAGVKVSNNDLGHLPKLEEITVDYGSRYYSTEDGVLYDASGKTLLLFPAARGGAFTVPNDVTTINSNAFYSCGLQSIHCPASLEVIGSFAFDQCKHLASISIADGVTTLGKGAFHGCTSLTQLQLPTSVTALGESTFDGCSQLQSLAMPGVTQLAKKVCAGCSSLTNFTISDQLTTVPQQAFENCTSLTQVHLPATVTIIDEKAFKGCSRLTTVTLSDNLTTIGKEAFRECTSLTRITIPAQCSTIDKEAFRQCKSLSVVDLGDALRTIGDNALRETAIIKLALPATITHVGKKVAEKCNSLLRIECHATTPPQLDKVSNDKLELYVPSTAVEAYKKAKNWKNFKRILPLN